MFLRLTFSFDLLFLPQIGFHYLRPPPPNPPSLRGDQVHWRVSPSGGQVGEGRGAPAEPTGADLSHSDRSHQSMGEHLRRPR